MRTFISTGAFRTRDIHAILQTAEENGIRRIEISPGLDYCRDINELLLREKDRFEFLIHNYFPTPKVPFALNLASGDRGVLERSMAMCREAIGFVAAMGIPHYSVHCGYCFDTDGSHLGNRTQVSLPRIPYGRARDTFVGCLRELADFAAGKGVGLAIENNVMADFAEGDKGLFLGVDTGDMLELVGLTGRPNVGVLLDLAHAKVSDSSLGFGLDDMVERLRPYLMEVHISGNDGKADQNLPLDGQDALLAYLGQIGDIPVTLETYNLSIDEIKSQIRLVDFIGQ